jgi:hypothetical protein
MNLAAKEFDQSHETVHRLQAFEAATLGRTRSCSFECVYNFASEHIDHICWKDNPKTTMKGKG